MKNKEFVPVLHYLLVKVEAEPEKTQGGIYLPDTSEKTRRNAGKELGTILGIGETAFTYVDGTKDTSVKVGQLVYFTKYAGLELKLTDELHYPVGVYRVIKDEDVIGIVKDKTKDKGE